MAKIYNAGSGFGLTRRDVMKIREAAEAATEEMFRNWRPNMTPEEARAAVARGNAAGIALLRKKLKLGKGK